MPYKGHVENGTIVLDESVTLPEGAKVVVQIEREQTPPKQYARLSERFASLIGKAEGFPEDWSEHHDAYLRDEHRG